MRVLITGGLGFIGSHLSDELIKQGHSVSIIDNLSSGKISNVQADKLVFIQADLLDIDYLEKSFNAIKPDVVYHLAAQINVRDSIKNPINDADINIIGSLNVLNCCIKYNVKKIIFTSSGGAIYKDNGSKDPKPESAEISPESPYGIAKYTVEQYIDFYKKVHNLDYSIFRLSNVIGPRQAGGECGVLSIFIKNILEGKNLTVFGDGEQTRDYVDVFSVVQALLLGIKVSGTYNVSTSRSTSVNELISTLGNYIKLTDIVDAPRIEGELMHNCLDNKLLKSIGWQPTMNFEEAVKITVKHFSNLSAQ